MKIQYKYAMKIICQCQTLYGNPVLVQLECVTSYVVLRIAYVFIFIEDKGVLEKGVDPNTNDHMGENL